MKANSEVKHPIITRLGDILQDSDGLLTLLKLNLLFFFTVLPVVPFISVFTFGGGMTALILCISKLVKTGSLDDVSKTYLSLFKKYFKSSSLYGAVVYIMTVILSAGLYIYLKMSGENIIFIPFASISLVGLICIWSVSIHLFVAIENHNPADKKSLLKYSVARAMISFKKTLSAVLIGFTVFIVMILFLPATIPLILTCAFSVPALAAGFANTEPEFII